MNKKDDLFGIGVTAPFGDGTELNPYEWHDECNCKREKGYEKLCKGCSAITPEAMKDFIPDEVMWCDEHYYCEWCDFIQVTGIDKILVEYQKEKASKKVVRCQEEDDGLGALWDLEDAGAFADEGIMPGCHSNDWDYKYEFESIEREFADMAFVGQCIKLAREKVGVSMESLADKLQIPEHFIHNIENGEYINFYGDKLSNLSLGSAIPVPVIPSAENSICIETQKKWWQGCSDYTIKEKIADYLCSVLHPNTVSECETTAQFKVTDSEDGLPF